MISRHHCTKTSSLVRHFPILGALALLFMLTTAEHLHAQSSSETQAQSETDSLTPEQKQLLRNVGAFDFTIKVDLAAIGNPGTVINGEGKSSGQMILQNKFVIMQNTDTLGDSISINGWREDSKEYFSFSFESGRTPFGYVQGNMTSRNNLVMKDPSGMVTVSTTFEKDRQTKTEVLIGPQKALLMSIESKPARRHAANVIRKIMASPLKPTKVNRATGSDDPAENFAAEHLELQKYVGDFQEENSDHSVTSRMVCQGRYLFNVSQDGAGVTDISVVGFDNARKMFQMALFEASSTVPRYFEGTADGNGGLKLKDPFDPKASFEVRPDKNGGYTATFSDGTEGGARTLSFTSRTPARSR